MEVGQPCVIEHQINSVETEVWLGQAPILHSRGPSADNFPVRVVGPRTPPAVPASVPCHGWRIGGI